MTDIRHSDGAFETVIETYRLGNGHVSVDREHFNWERAFFLGTVLIFIRGAKLEHHAMFGKLRNATEKTIALLKKCLAALMVPSVRGQTDKREAV